MWFWKRPDTDFEAEIESHIAIEAERLIAEGMPPRAAHEAARRAFGNLGIARERFYHSQRWRWWDELRQDLRYGLRSLAKAPSFTAAVALTVALGIGANTAVFSLVDAVLLRRLPVPEPSGLVFIKTAGRAGSENSPPFRAFTRLREQIAAFSGIAAFSTDELRIELDGVPEPVNGQIASGDYFPLLGLTPALGRLLDTGDEKQSPPAAVISDRYWRRRFAADPAVLGKTFAYAGRTYTIVGITPPGFQGLRPGFAVDVTIPISPRLEDALGGSEVIARVKPRVALVQAESQTTAVLHTVLAELGFSEAQISQRFRQVELRSAAHGADTLRTRFAKPLYILMGIAALVLLLATANIANLLLVRGFTRSHEFAIRLTAGAGRARLSRQLATETLLLFTCGALPGIVLARAAVTFIEGMFAEPRRAITIHAGLNWRVLGFAIAVTLATGLFAALLPAWRVLRSSLEQVIREGQMRNSESRRASALRQALVASQVAVSMVLLVSSISFAGTLARLRDLDPGMRNAQVLTMSVELPEGYVQAKKSGPVWQNVATAVRGIAGVQSAALATFTPFSGRDRWRPMSARGYVPASTADSLVHFDHVTEGYFETLGIPLLQGRLFTSRDSGTAAKVAVINESAARRFFSGRDPLGQVVAFGDLAYTVVGVVRDTQHSSLREPPVPFAFLPLSQPLYPERRITLSAGATSPGREAALLHPIRRKLADVDPGLMISEVISIERQVEATLLTERLLSGLATAFGVLAMILASVGLYGVLNYRIGQQRQEIGIRMALGESAASVAAGVLRQSVAVIAVGILCGLPLAIAVSRAAGSLLWGVSSGDPAIYAWGAGILGVAGIASAWLPARRASAIEPAALLRHN